MSEGKFYVAFDLAHKPRGKIDENYNELRDHLNENGFICYNFLETPITQEILRVYDLLVFICPDFAKISRQEIMEIVNWVKDDGGGLLLLNHAGGDKGRSSNLDELSEKARKLGLSRRVKTINCSLFELEFPDESFDIIWAEGALAPIGFERALKEWGRLLKIKGFMVFHDDLQNKERKLKIIPNCGYVLLDHFQLPDDAWWIDYYKPLEKRIKDVRTKYEDDPKVIEVVKKYQNEINAYKKNPNAFRSIFYIIQKIN